MNDINDKLSEANRRIKLTNDFLSEMLRGLSYALVIYGRDSETGILSNDTDNIWTIIENLRAAACMLEDGQQLVPLKH